METDLVVVMVPTTQLEESVHFYCDLLGLELLEEWQEMGRGALLKASENAQIELVEMDIAPSAEEPCTTIGLKVVSGVDAVHARLVAAGARIKAPPRERAWGMYGFGTFDPNGVPINIYEPITPEDRGGDGDDGRPESG